MKILAPGFYKNVFGIGFLALILLGLVVPTIQSALRPRGKTQFRLTEPEMATLKSDADRGSAASARRIYEHFVYFERDRTNAFQWLERAAILGDERAKSSMKGVYESTGIEGYRGFLGRTNESAEAVFIQAIYPKQ